MIRQRLVLFLLLLATVASAQETAPVSVGDRQLFLDDQGIAKIDGLQRTMHQPKKRGAVIVPDRPWETALQTRCTPVWDEQAKRYKLWLITSTPAPGVAGTTYAESVDGVKWTKPILRQWKYQASLENNFIAVEPDSAWPANAMENVVYDPDDADPQRRFKGFLGAIGRQPIVSPDGIHWKKLDVPMLSSEDESNLSYDRQSRTFIATLKTGGPFGRSHGIWTSKDFQTWTNTGVLIHADEEDQRMGKANIRARLADDQLQQPRYNDPADYNADVYNVGVFRYEGLYVALPAVYHATGKIPVGNTDGFHLVQLRSSRDLQTWQHVADRQTFIGPSPIKGGAFDLTQLLPPSAPLVRDDELWFYYTGLKYRAEPAPAVAGGMGAICLAVLRRDGFVSLDAGETPGTITSKPFKWLGSKLMANVETRDRGELRAEVLDTAGEVIATSLPLKGNHPRGEFRWSQSLPESLHERQVSLRFTLREASFYSWWLE
ncbi:MAG: hypothetical protein NT069_24905 [Planctomycetota bacterium]|nr:hypothetical protein [Planctomycetota bacterium]